MKKLFILLSVFLLSMAAMAEAVEINGICYELDANTQEASVTQNPNYYTGSVEIPAKIVFDNVEYSVTSIGNYAFAECSGLISITIPNSVNFMGWAAFDGCSSLTSVHISDLEAWCKIVFCLANSNPLYDAEHLYLNGEEIRDLVIPNNIVTIKPFTFEGCSGLTSVTIPNSVTSIGYAAFQRCSGLTSIDIPNSVTSIDDQAFESCYGLTSVTFPNSLTSIGAGAFDRCTDLTEVHITDLEAWCKIAFNSATLYNPHHLYLNDEEIKDLVIPNSVTSIGNSTFAGCSGLTSITIPNSVTSIGGSAWMF